MMLFYRTEPKKNEGLQDLFNVRIILIMAL